MLYDFSESVEVDRIYAVLDSILSAFHCSKMQARVVLSDTFVRYFIVTLAPGSRGTAERRAVADRKFELLYAADTSGWQVDALWHSSKPYLAYAVPNGIIGGVTQAAKRHHLKLRSVVPSFIGSWNEWSSGMTDHAWFCNVIDQTLCLAIVANKHLHSVVTTAIPAEASCEWFRLHLEQGASRLNLPFPRTYSFVVMCRRAGSSRRRATRFLPTRTQRGGRNSHESS